MVYFDPSEHGQTDICPPETAAKPEDTNAKRISDNNISSNKPLSEMSDAELGELGYKRHGDGSIRDKRGHFAGNCGSIPRTPRVEKSVNYDASGNITIEE